MDMLMVDVTNIPCEAGDTAVIFDQQHGAQDFAEGAGTISYELLTGLSKRIRRSIVP
jgi:alanine racemase